MTPLPLLKMRALSRYINVMLFEYIPYWQCTSFIPKARGHLMVIYDSVLQTDFSIRKFVGVSIEESP